MPKNTLSILLLLFSLALAARTSSAQGFEGIVPMRSTCLDVEHAFGAELCGKGEKVITRENERVRFAFSTKPCETFFGQRWNILTGTVVIIERSFLEPVSTQSLGIVINDSEYTKTFTDIIGHVIYDKKTGDLGISLIDGKVSAITYFPSTADKRKLSCKCGKKGI